MQDEGARIERLKKAEEEYQLEDDTAGGQQNNELLSLRRQQKQGGGKPGTPAADSEEQSKEGAGSQVGPLTLDAIPRLSCKQVATSEVEVGCRTSLLLLNAQQKL